MWWQSWRATSSLSCNFFKASWTKLRRRYADTGMTKQQEVAKNGSSVRKQLSTNNNFSSASCYSRYFFRELINSLESPIASTTNYEAIGSDERSKVAESFWHYVSSQNIELLARWQANNTMWNICQFCIRQKLNILIV